MTIYLAVSRQLFQFPRRYLNAGELLVNISKTAAWDNSEVLFYLVWQRYMQSLKIASFNPKYPASIFERQSNRMETCSYQHPSDAELASVIKMKMSLPVISSATASSLHHHHGNSRTSSAMMQHLPKSDIGNAVAKVLQGYDWSLVPLASR